MRSHRAVTVRNALCVNAIDSVIDDFDSVAKRRRASAWEGVAKRRRASAWTCFAGS